MTHRFRTPPKPLRWWLPLLLAGVAGWASLDDRGDAEREPVAPRPAGEPRISGSLPTWLLAGAWTEVDE